MTPDNAFYRMLQQQMEWASDKSINRNPKSKYYAYADTLADNLRGDFLSVSTVDEFSSGQGQELKSHMKALYSSSALLLNIFEYWKQTHRIFDIAYACGAKYHMTKMVFEKKYEIPTLGTPHLDIEFSADDVKPLAIESKFTEPYQKTTQRNETNLDKYLSKDELWHGLNSLKYLAEEIFQEEGYKTNWHHLDAPQLIKHVLGLSRYYQPEGFTLLYLWYDYDSPESKEHQKEIHHFSTSLNRELNFRSMTYQDLFRQIEKISNVDSGYLKYIQKRYFSEV